MDTAAIRNAIRRKVVRISGIDPEKQLMTTGNTFDPLGLDLWCMESVVGGDVSVISNKRIGSTAYLIQYDFCVPVSGDVDAAETMAQRVCSSLLQTGALEVPGEDCHIRSARVSGSTGNHFCNFTVLITLGIRSNG